MEERCPTREPPPEEGQPPSNRGLPWPLGCRPLHGRGPRWGSLRLNSGQRPVVRLDALNPHVHHWAVLVELWVADLPSGGEYEG